MKKLLSFLMCLIIIFSLSIQVFAMDSDTVNAIINDTAKYLYETVSSPQVGSVGGEWCVLGLARSDAHISDVYFENYYRTLEKYVKDRKGILHDKKYTEYSRVIISLTSIGKNPADVAGYNLLVPLGDYEKTIWQGINGAIWALIALDSAGYEIPQNPNAVRQATREMYINYILNNQIADGGWALSGDVADVDVTAMALQALSKYQDQEKVKSAIEKAVFCMSDKQNESGGFESYGTETSESSVQMLVALCELGISVDDVGFVKNGNTVLDDVISYYESGKGFKHTKDGDTNQMATEQCFYALVALKRANEGKNSLYDMSDVTVISDSNYATGFTEKNNVAEKISVVSPGKTFGDIAGHENKSAIEALAERNIISGKTEDVFEPDNTMTRAEFAAIIVRGLGLRTKSNARFTDVTSDDWFFDFVNTAHSFGIVNGVSDTEFNPNGKINREEAAVMIARAAKLCGNDTDIDAFSVRDILAGFIDYVKASDWAASSLAFCYYKGIFSDDVMEIKSKEAVTRAEVAQMLYNMLLISKLI